MKDGICPKCKAENVRIVDSNRTGFWVPLRSIWSSGAATNYYVCGECGLVETYVENKGDLEKINGDWEQVKVKKQ